MHLTMNIVLVNSAFFVNFVFFCMLLGTGSNINVTWSFHTPSKIISRKVWVSYNILPIPY